MILKFPDIDTLRVSLTDGAVPPAVSQTAAQAGLDDDGGVWLDTPANLSKSAQAELRRKNVQVAKRFGARMTYRVSCWLEMIPLHRESEDLAHPEQSAVLFDLPGGQQLARMATEILRLGNDRQSYRWLEETTGRKDENDVRVLLRVVGPPYYSLLRALDPKGPDATRAFIEKSIGSRVWVQLGYTHPLIKQIKAPAGQMVLLRPLRQWTYLPEAPFRDVYEIMEFALPGEKLDWQDGEVGEKLKVPLSLTRGGGTEAAELWVLRDDPVAELNTLVQNADDHLLARLSFAVAEHHGKKTIILKARPSKLPPPILNEKGETLVAFRPYLKMPNLFLPCGWRLHPPLRRDILRKLLADDSSVLTWLYPTGNGKFVPETLPQDAFRPLTDWIDYVIEHEREPLQTWVQSTTFDFESFVCNEDDPARPKKPPAPDRVRNPNAGKTPGRTLDPADLLDVNFDKTVKEIAVVDEDDPAPALEKVEPTKLQSELRDLEERFITLEGELDVEERLALWPEMADLNQALKNTGDAGICWMNALWSHDQPPPRWLWAWFQTEAAPVEVRQEKGQRRGHRWVAQATQSGGGPREVSADNLDYVLNLKDPLLADVRALAAYVVWAARRTPPPPALVERLNAVQNFLEENESLLSIRGTWLTWVAFVQMTGGDVLALARARDRLLERLFHNGLRPEQDLPGFLRFSGQPTSQRFRAVRQWMGNLCGMAHSWSKDPANGQGSDETQAYINLIFAYGLARLGEVDASRKLQDEARKVLTTRDEAHQALFRAYVYRTKMAQEGKRNSGPLPADEISAPEKDRMKRYLVERLRQHSRILEPEQKIDPYRPWSAKTSELEKALSDLIDLTDRKEIIERTNRLLHTHAPKGNKGLDAQVSILSTALNLAPRVSEEFALDMLTQLLPAYNMLPEVKDATVLEQQARLLEKGLFVAAHFDRKDTVAALVSRFQALLRSQRGNAGAIQTLDTLAEHSFRGLRKLGMREEIDTLLRQMAEAILNGQDVSNFEMKPDRNGAVALRALLHVAGGWLYFGRERQAEPIINAVRSLLFKNELHAREQAPLARAYALTVGQAPIEAAQKRLEELFHRLQGVKDTFTTNTHYSLLQLDVVEAVVLAVVNEDSAMGADARRWLDDDEFIVRRRIHRDFHAMKSQAH
ncbi:MAG TPA: hypothetical protein VKD72_09480 [Gemmataceae bacterium]|nr:hypothetical protein [Gemmataceae bacterium]